LVLTKALTELVTDMERVAAAFCGGVPESVTVNTTVEVENVLLGVPLSTPVK
jgi:hypothetical protein